MKKLCITNQKGGSGKTSFSVLVALAIANKGYKVLAVDCDPQGGLTTYLSKIDYKKKRKGLFDVLTGDDNYNFIPIDRKGIKFDLLAADHRLDAIASNLSPYELERKFDKFDYHYIIYDTPPTTQGISRAAAITADKIFIPADISEGTINPTLFTIGELKKIKKKGKVFLIGYKEPDPESKSFIAETSRDFISAIGKSYGGPIAKSVAMQKAVAGTNKKWTPKQIDKILDPILNLIEVM